MTWQNGAAAALLVIGVGIELVSCLGLLAMEDLYDRLHFLGPAATLGPAVIAAAVILREALSTAGIKALLIAVVLLLTGPVLTHALARAARLRRRGAWEIGPDEPVEEV